MTTEQEMLEYAAKACGIELVNLGFAIGPYLRCTTKQWNPLTNSADCAAMCAKLEIDWRNAHGAVICDTKSNLATVEYAKIKNHDNSRLTAWMYAATKVAAKIGGMK